MRNGSFSTGTMLGVCLLAVFTGCRSTGGSGNAAELERVYLLHKAGDYRTIDLPISIAELHRAVLLGFHDLELKTLANRVDRHSSQVSAIFAEEEIIEVKMQKVDLGTARVYLRSGFDDNPERVLLIFRAISRHFPGKWGSMGSPGGPRVELVTPWHSVIEE